MAIKKNNKSFLVSKSPFTWVKMHKLTSFGIFILVFGVGMFGYNKYLDYQNVNDMKQLLADFEKLETDVEAETGEQLYIEANCGSVGKFATSYTCTVRLKPSSEKSSETLIANITSRAQGFSSFAKYECMAASAGHRLKSDTDDYYLCSGAHVRLSSSKKIETIYSEYDTSPNSPY